jgi:hypothetical protein
MATWKGINSLWSTQDPSIQARIDQAFKAKWCHLGIFGVDCATIVWCFLPPLYFLDFFNVWWGCCLPPLLGVFSERGKNIKEFCKVIFGTTLISYLVDPLLSPHPQFVDIHKVQKLKKKIWPTTKGLLHSRAWTMADRTSWYLTFWMRPLENPWAMGLWL